MCDVDHVQHLLGDSALLNICLWEGNPLHLLLLWGDGSPGKKVAGCISLKSRLLQQAFPYDHS